MIGKPDELIAVPGVIQTYNQSEPPVSYFDPRYSNDSGVFRPGVSGSPIIYKEYIIGLVPLTYRDPDNGRLIGIGAVVFNDKKIRESMRSFGIRLKSVG